MKFSTYILMLLFTGVAFSSASAQTAPDIATQPCDTEYWRQMSARAWMEAEREIMQNQNLIFKADSVLEYTCFDQFVSINAYQGGNIFTHTTYFGTPIIQRSANESMNNALNAVVINALNAYKSGSFSNSFLSGRADHMTIANTNSQFISATTNAAYTCNIMADVWKTAKCANFIDDAAFQSTDGFYPFETITGHNGTPDVDGYNGGIQETRQWPPGMSCQNSAGGPRGSSGQTFGPAGTWNNQIALANNDALYEFQTPLAAIYEEVGDKLEPGNCGQPAILTGVTVYKQGSRGVAGGPSHPDGVCTNPGCSYQGSTGICKSTGATPPPCTGPGPC